MHRRRLGTRLARTYVRASLLRMVRRVVNFKAWRTSAQGVRTMRFTRVHMRTMHMTILLPKDQRVLLAGCL
jgi:hypothetical protein